MNQSPRELKGTKPIDLAAEGDFTLGGLSICPSRREIRTGESCEMVEPRVMQVLVALARADGAVVSRDQLIERCWGGRLVGDDAINSCVAKVRALASLTASSAAFEIETVPRVGYRLQAKREDSLAPAPVPPGANVAAGGNSSRATFALGRGWWLAAALGVLVVAVVAIVTLIPTPRKEWVVAEARQPFISTPALELTPSLSPNGAMIAYAGGADALHLSLYVRLRSGGDSRRLTTGDSAYEPVWSPDGGTIAYVSKAPGRRCRIMLIDALGGTPREATACRSFDDTDLSWSGNSLIYTDAPITGAPSAIMRLNLGNGESTPLTHPNNGETVGDALPVISPDGKTLAFVRQIHWSRADIRLRDLATGSERVLLSSRDEDLSIAWSTDSKTLFAARNTPWDSALWAYPVSGAVPQRVTESPIAMGGLSSGPDGLLTMELHTNRGDLAIAPGASDGSQKELATDGYQTLSIEYAPDGTLAMIARRSGVFGVFVVGTDGAFHKLIGLQSDVAGGISWSPDSSRIAFIDGDKTGLWVNITDRSGATKRFPLHVTETSSTHWSDDGKSLLFTHFDSHGWCFWRMDLANPEAEVRLPPCGWQAVRKRAGMMFGTKDSERGIWRIDGIPRRLTDWPLVGSVYFWTMAGDEIIYLDSSDPNEEQFKALSIYGGPPRTIGYPKGRVTYGFRFAVDPKTGLVTFFHSTLADSDIGWMRLRQSAH